MTKTRFLKTLFCVIIVVFFVLLFSMCLLKKEALPLNDVVARILTEKGIEKSEITYLCANFDDEITELYNRKTTTVTDKEVREFVDDLLLSHNKIIAINERNIVQEGDVIVVSYIARYKSKIVESVSKDSLLVGSGNYWDEFENAVIGASVGDPFLCELKSSKDTEEYKKDSVLQYTITVESINYFETHKSSDRYILDYYGCETEEDFWEQSKIRLQRIKEYENQNSADIEFLDTIAKKCKFYIDKEEIVVYSKKIVDYYKDMAYIRGLELSEYIKTVMCMPEEEFYDYCYNEGVKEIKRYLLVGAYTSTISCNGKDYKKFCTMSGYDNTQSESGQKYDYLKTVTIAAYRHLAIKTVSSLVFFDDKKSKTVDIYDAANIYTIDFSTTAPATLTQETQESILSALQNIKFGRTIFNNSNQLYQKVIIVKENGKTIEKFFVDEINGYVKRELKDGSIVCAELKNTQLSDLIQLGKTGDGYLFDK